MICGKEDISTDVAFFILFFHPEHNKSAIRFHYVNEKADDSDQNLDG